MMTYSAQKLIKLFFVIGILVSCGGCLGVTYAKVPERYPVYEPLPHKAVISVVTAEELSGLGEDTRNKIISTVTNLKGEAASLRAIVEQYNSYAKERNLDFEAYLKGK